MDYPSPVYEQNLKPTQFLLRIGSIWTPHFNNLQLSPILKPHLHYRLRISDLETRISDFETRISDFKTRISDVNPLFSTFEKFGGRLKTMTLASEIRTKWRWALGKNIWRWTYLLLFCSNSLLISATELRFVSSSSTTSRCFGTIGFFTASGFGFFVGSNGTFFGALLAEEPCKLALLSSPSRSFFGFSNRLILLRSFNGRVRKFGFFFEALPGPNCRFWNCSWAAENLTLRGAGFGAPFEAWGFAFRGAGIGALIPPLGGDPVATEESFCFKSGVLSYSKFT